MENDQINVNEPNGLELEPVITTKEWLKSFLLLLIPVANLVFMIIWAIGGEGISLSKRNLFRAYWILYAIIMGIYLACIILFLIFWFLIIGVSQ